MLALVVSLTLSRPSLVDTLDALAKAKDGRGLERYLAEPVKGRSPFAPILGGGAYSVGRFGWHAAELKVPDGAKLVVFWTPLTSEDVGEQVFRELPGDKLRKLDEADDLGIHIERQSLEVGFEPKKKLARISARVEFKRLDRAGPWFLIRMSPHYVVSAVLDDQGHSVPFSEAGGVVAVPTPTAKSFTYQVNYQGVVDLPGYAGAVTEGEAMLTNDYWYPMIARQPFAFDVKVKTSAKWDVVAQGEKTSESIEGDVKTTSYRMDLPVTYWSLDAGPMHRVSKKFGDRTIWSAAVDVPESQMADQPELYRPILEFYDKAFGKYPFSGYGAMISKLYGGGALEAYSFATYGGDSAPGEDPHETAHTWWGGMIDNTYLKSFWNESFADYCQGLYSRNAPIGNQAERSLAYVWTPRPSPAYNAAPMIDSGVEIGAAAGTIGYGKGADVLQMLEQELGTDRMIETMKTWIDDQPKGVAGEWEDYEAAVYKVAGAGLKWFFDQWMRRPGYADFDVSGLRWDQGRLSGNVGFKSLPYRIDCEVLIQFADGRRTYSKFNTTQTMTGSGYSFSLDCPEKPALVSIDPWRRVLRPIHDDEEPIGISGGLRDSKRYTDPNHPDYLAGVGTGHPLSELPRDLDGVFIVGHPDSLPAMQKLCDRVGFHVVGRELTYGGTKIDLNEGGAIAVVDLPGGKKCTIGLGKVRHEPNVGRARLIVFDGLGRFLRGKTEPKTEGYLTFRL